MVSYILRFRKLCYLEPAVRRSSSCSGGSAQKSSTETTKDDHDHDQHHNNFVVIEEKQRKRKSQQQQQQQRRQGSSWRCVDSCCWAIGCICTAWWVLLLVCQCLPATMPATESPGERLRREEGLVALHPVVLVPGIVTGGLELWEGKPCSYGLFRKRLWGGSFTEIFKRFAVFYPFFFFLVQWY